MRVVQFKKPHSIKFHKRRDVWSLCSKFLTFLFLIPMKHEHSKTVHFLHWHIKSWNDRSQTQPWPPLCFKRLSSKCLNRKPMQCHRETSYHISKAETRQGPVLNLWKTPEELGLNESEWERHCASSGGGRWGTTARFTLQRNQPPRVPGERTGKGKATIQPMPWFIHPSFLQGY